MSPRLLARSWPHLLLQVPSFSSLLKAVYNPKAFFPHAALLHQAFAHCARFPTAASRRSLGRVSVPVWLIILSDQLPVDALVSRYLTNKLIGRETLPNRKSFLRCAMRRFEGIRYWQSFPTVIPKSGAGFSRVTHPFATRSSLTRRITGPRSTCMC